MKFSVSSVSCAAVAAACMLASSVQTRTHKPSKTVVDECNGSDDMAIVVYNGFAHYKSYRKRDKVSFLATNKDFKEHAKAIKKLRHKIGSKSFVFKMTSDQVRGLKKLQKKKKELGVAIKAIAAEYKKSTGMKLRHVQLSRKASKRLVRGFEKRGIVPITPLREARSKGSIKRLTKKFEEADGSKPVASNIVFVNGKSKSKLRKLLKTIRKRDAKLVSMNTCIFKKARKESRSEDSESLPQDQLSAWRLMEKQRENDAKLGRENCPYLNGQINSSEEVGSCPYARECTSTSDISPTLPITEMVNLPVETGDAGDDASTKPVEQHVEKIYGYSSGDESDGGMSFRRRSTTTGPRSNNVNRTTALSHKSDEEENPSAAINESSNVAETVESDSSSVPSEPVNGADQEPKGTENEDANGNVNLQEPVVNDPTASDNANENVNTQEPVVNEPIENDGTGAGVPEQNDNERESEPVVNVPIANDNAEDNVTTQEPVSDPIANENADDIESTGTASQGESDNEKEDDPINTENEDNFDDARTGLDEQNSLRDSEVEA